MTTQAQNKKVGGAQVLVLRFPEFSGEWEEKKLGEIATFQKGRNISKEDISRDGNLECIRYGELYTHYKEVIRSVKSRANLKSEDLVLSESNDVIIPASGETQWDIATVACVLMSGVALGGDINIIRSKEDGAFLAYYLGNARRRNIARLSQGNSVVHLYLSQLKSLKLLLPPIEEQQKIAEFLGMVHEKIEGLSKKKESLERYKKSVMQKIFSQEIRFKDKNGNLYPNWEERRLGEVAAFQKGKNISKEDISEDGNFECIRYGELYTEYKEVIRSIKSRTHLKLDSLVLSESNDVIIPASGETQWDIATASCVLKDGVALGGDINIIRNKENGVFLAYYLSNAKRKGIARLSQGNSVVHLYSSQLKSLKLILPSLPEQQKISDFLTSLDEKISAIGNELSSAKEFKKGLLQKMFV